MNVPNNLTIFSSASTDDDPLESLVRQAARVMLQSALQAEVNDYLQRQPHQRHDPESAFRGYRNGSSKQRKVTVGSGTIPVNAPRVSHTPETQEPFASQILKPYQRRSQTLSELFPKLFIEGLATRDFEPALRCLLGAEAALSPSTISRLNAQFKAEYEDWLKVSLASLPILYAWVDGTYLKAGLGDERACLLVVFGADVTGKKQLLALEEGFRESI